MPFALDLGTGAIDMLTENAKEFTRAASILGVFVIGCLTVCYGGTKLGLVIPNGTTESYVAHHDGSHRRGQLVYGPGLRH